MTETDLRREFANPGAAWRGKPFWSWNGELREKELVRQIGVMKKMGLGGCFLHSRAGLITEYLGEEWFSLINAAADAAEAEGMEAWLYDEDRWPSGSAGGKVTEDPRFRMKSLVLFQTPPALYAPSEDTLFLFAARVDGVDLYACRPLTDPSAEAVRAAAAAFAAETEGAPGAVCVLRFAVVPDAPDSTYNGSTYADTMMRAATDRFIELTHEAYAAHCGDRLGRSIKGIFTDEPHRGHCMDDRTEKDGAVRCSMCWTDDFFEEFEKRYGYDARPLLPELFYRPNGEAVAPVKLHWIDLADHLFIERFAVPIEEWCRAHGMIFTGHVLHEDSLMNQTAPHGSLMRFYEHMGYPGVDVLSEHNRCWWVVKQLASAARQTGRKRLLSELYGCTGWQFDLRGHKAVGDWQALFGVNLRCPHLSWYTMEGESKRDYPASILHQSPWWPDYPAVEDYFARFGVLMSEGSPACDVLVLNPIESLWCQAYAGWAKWIENASPDVAPYEARYRELFGMLTGRQIDFDYGEEEMMSRLGGVSADAEGRPVLTVGKAAYRVAVVTNMLTIRPSTLSLLARFRDAGGCVIFAGEAPAYADARPSSAPEALARRCVRVAFDSDAIAEAIRTASAHFVSVTGPDGAAEPDVFVQVRRDFDGDGYAAAVLNSDRETGRGGLTLSLRVPEGFALQEWDPQSGERRDASALAGRRGDCVTVSFDLPPSGTRFFVLTHAREALPPARVWRTEAAFEIRDGFETARDEPNVCVLDRVRWRMDGGAWSEETEVLRADRAIRGSVGLEPRSGAMLQPWFAKLADPKVYGRAELIYEFEIDRVPEGPVFLAGERPELNAYALNGVPLHAGDPDDFWIDDCFKKMPVPAGLLRPGRNAVTAAVDFRRTTNVEALYLVGEFGVALDGPKRTLTALPGPVGCADYADFGLPFYTGCVTFRLTPERYLPLLGAAAGSAERIALSPVGFTGACVRVTALGKTQILGWEPFEADVTEAVRAGAPVDVTAVGTRRNLFGPLHQIPALAKAYGPPSFVTSGAKWTDSYVLLDSGLRGVALKVQKDPRA